MKNNYIIAIFVFLLSIQLGNAQECPYEIGNSSTVTDPHFKIVPATCADYPDMITIDGSTFTKVICNGSNLFYTLDAGQTPLSSSVSFVADFGFAVCTYLNSQLQTLSVESFSHSINSLRVFPNPLTGSDQLSVQFDKNVSAQLNIYDLTGKLVISEEIENSSTKQIHISSLNSGVYMLQIVADSASTSRKIVVMK
jgi:hypothetical protein